MAIVFLKELDVTKIKLSYNNNLVRFYTDSGVLPINANISVGGTSVTLFPDPSGVFTYNFKTLVSTILNVDNFKDDLNPDLDTAFVYDWTNKISLSGDVVTTINLSNETTETDTRSITWLSAFVELRDWKKTYPANDLLVGQARFLQKENRTDLYDYHLNYWNGYPFDITIFNSTNNDIDVENLTNLSNNVFINTHYINRLVFSDGRTDVSIEDVLPLQQGFNKLRFLHNAGSYFLALNKITDHCPNGIYLKWINSFGGWNYWLFSKGQEQLKTKSLGALNNDFDNLEDTISPLVSLGKESEVSIKVREQRIKSYDKEILTDLLDSAKVYMFTGVPFSKNTFNDWIEVNIGSGNFTIENSRSDLYRLDLSIELAQNVTRSL